MANPAGSPEKDPEDRVTGAEQRERARADTAPPAIADDSGQPDEAGTPHGDDLGAGAD
jgi:hypothetical protein